MGTQPALLEDQGDVAVGFGCANPGCDGIAYFPSQPGDLCSRCQGEANDAIRDAACEVGL